VLLNLRERGGLADYVQTDTISLFMAGAVRGAFYFVSKCIKKNHILSGLRGGKEVRSPRPKRAKKSNQKLGCTHRLLRAQKRLGGQWPIHCGLLSS
jgi:hypothetical protein